MKEKYCDICAREKCLGDTDANVSLYLRLHDLGISTLENILDLCLKLVPCCQYYYSGKNDKSNIRSKKCHSNP